MKILTVVFDLQKGGTQRAAQNFCVAYHKLGYDSRMLAFKSDGVRGDQVRALGITVWVDFNPSLPEIHNWAPQLIHLHSHGLTNNEISALLDAFPSAQIVASNVFSKP